MAPGANAAKNVALAGHYGSGKSSVLLGVQAGLSERGIKWINLSLSSIGIDSTTRARVQADGSVPPLTNLIQKEIVKQLLYRKAPSAMPGSRYLRIDSFRWIPALLWSIVVGSVFVVVAILLGLVGRIEQVAPSNVVEGHDWSAWVIVLAFGVFVAGTWLLGQRTMQNRIKVDSVSAGGAAVALSKKENSYFDEYLDEIVYFFQRTRTSVAIFEDLDRFRDPHIFETLRELNVVLNNSEQIRSRPIRFVYAVRDSIFEQLNEDGGMLDTTIDDQDADARLEGLETSPSANRTKFFDLVVPMVPFITHRSARDLIIAEFKGALVTPSPALVNLVGAYLTDMRLIRNIRNEFDVYAETIFATGGLKGLTPDRLFAMMVFKNLHLQDFEQIRHGGSRLDRAYAEYRRMVDHQVAQQTHLSQLALEQTQVTSWEERAKAGSQRLARRLPLLMRWASNRPLYVRTPTTNYSIEQLAEVEFWQDLTSGLAQVEVVAGGYQSVTLTIAEFVDLAGLGTLKSLSEADKQVHLQRSSRAIATREFVAHASMAQLITRTDLEMPDGHGGQASLAKIVRGIVSPLVFELLSQGFIDENFTLYCSDYHDVALSITAMNFILHCVQPNRPDAQFRFDGDESIRAVAAESGPRLFDGSCVYNVDIFDYFLAHEPKQLEAALMRLAVAAPADTTFVDVYLATGKEARILTRLLAPLWPGTLAHMATSPAVPIGERRTLVSIAVGSISDPERLEPTEEVIAYLQENYSSLTVFTEETTDEAAQRAIEVGQALGVVFRDLTDLAGHQRTHAIHHGLYPVTRRNLSTAIQTDGGVSLNRLRSSNATVYEHVVANLAEYIATLESDEPTIETPEHFTEIINEISETVPQELVEKIALNAASECRVAEISALGRQAWRAVVAAGRLTNTASNLWTYISENGVDQAVANAVANGTIANASELPEQEKGQLALALANSPLLTAIVKAERLGELNLSEWMDPATLNQHGVEAIPELLEAEVIPDDETSYAPLASHPYLDRERFFVKSMRLPQFVNRISLSSDDLARMMRSSQVAHTVKEALVADVDAVAPRLSRTAAIAICAWADHGNNIAPELIAALAHHRAPAESILVLLVPHLSVIQEHVLDEILKALGDGYERLTQTGHHRPRLAERAGTTELLDELKKRGRVSSYSRETFRGGIRVNMRH